jgi:hypothetical protein
LFGHFYFAAGFDGVTVGEIAAFGHGVPDASLIDIDFVADQPQI